MTKIINLSSLNIKKIINLENFINTKMENNDSIKSTNYKNKIYSNFNLTFKKFLIFFSSKHNCIIDNRLKNVLAPWWLQAVLFKMDREIISKNILNFNTILFYANEEVTLNELINHTQLKDEIGSNKILNNFIISLFLKDKLKYHLVKCDKNKQSNKYRYKKRLTKHLLINNFVILYLNFISLFKFLKLTILSDTSHYNRLNLFKDVLFCKVLPLLILPENNIKKQKTFKFNNFTVDSFLFELFSSEEILNTYKKNFILKLSEKIVFNNYFSHKGYLNYLYIRSTFEKLKLPSHKLKIYSHGGLFDALWTEEEISTKLVGAQWLKSKNHEVNKKYSVKLKKKGEGVLISLYGHSTYVSRFRSGMTHYEFIHEYVPNIKSFLDSIDTTKRRYILRVPPNRIINLDFEKYKDIGFFLDNNTDIRKTLSEIKIHIPTYNATLPYYSLLNNIPSIFFWKKHHFPLPSKFNEVEDELKNIDILHEEPSNLSNYLNKFNDEYIIKNWNKNFKTLNNFKYLLTL